MSAFTIKKARARWAPKFKRDLIAHTSWNPLEPPHVEDALFGGKDWSDLAVLTDAGSPLGQAVQVAQRYFTDDDIAAAMQGESDSVTLVVVDTQPAFLNAAMLADVLVGDLMAA
jgi:hypothetical protein